MKISFQQARWEIGATRARCSLEPGYRCSRFRGNEGLPVDGPLPEAGRLEPSLPGWPDISGSAFPPGPRGGYGGLDSRLRGNDGAPGCLVGGPGPLRRRGVMRPLYRRARAAFRLKLLTWIVLPFGQTSAFAGKLRRSGQPELFCRWISSCTGRKTDPRSFPLISKRSRLGGALHSSFDKLRMSGVSHRKSGGCPAAGGG